MTTVIAIKDETGVHIASDSMVLRSDTNKASESDLKFTRYRDGLLAIAGNSAFCTRIKRLLLHEAAINPTFSSNDLEIIKAELTSFFEYAKTDLLKSTKERFPLLFKDGIESVAVFLSEITIQFAFVNKDRLVRCFYSFTEGVCRLAVYPLTDTRVIFTLGSGGKFAKEYFDKYRYSGYSMYEALKNAILYASTKDKGTGLGVKIYRLATAH